MTGTNVVPDPKSKYGFRLEKFCPGCDPRWPLNVKRAARYNRSTRQWVTCEETRRLAMEKRGK